MPSFPIDERQSVTAAKMADVAVPLNRLSILRLRNTLSHAHRAMATVNNTFIAPVPQFCEIDASCDSL